MLQQSTEPLLTADLVEIRNGWRLSVFLSTDQPVAYPLMRPAFVIVKDEFADDVIEVLEAKDYEVIQRFMF